MDPDSSRALRAVADQRTRSRPAVCVTAAAARSARRALALARRVAPPARAAKSRSRSSPTRASAKLNRRYRGKDYATDVLSFPADAVADPIPDPGSTEPGTVPGRHRHRHGRRAPPGAEAGHSYSPSCGCSRFMVCFTCSATITTRGRRRPHGPRSKRGCGARAAFAHGPDRARPHAMIPLLLFLLAMAAVYVGTIETAFSALMRLSLRLMAERGGRDDRARASTSTIRSSCSCPARLLLGLIFSLATVVIAVLTGRTGFQSIGMLLVFVAVFILAVRARPAAAHRAPRSRAGARVLLPPFDVAARVPASADRHAGPAAVEPAPRAAAVPSGARRAERGQPARPRTPTSKPARSRG